jgi:hypothetical protein
MQPLRLLDLLFFAKHPIEIHAALDEAGCLDRRGRSSPALVQEGIRLGLAAHAWWTGTDAEETGFNPQRAHFVMPLLRYAKFLDHRTIEELDRPLNDPDAERHLRACDSCRRDTLARVAACVYCGTGRK